MTSATSATPTAAKPFRIAMLLPTLAVSVVAPIAIFKGLEACGVAPAWALAAGCAPPVLNNVRVWIASRRLDPVGLLMMGSIAGGPVASLISGEISSRIAVDCLTGAVWGLVFLGSLLLDRPVLFYLIRSLVAGDDAERTLTWNGLWRFATFRSAMRSMTAAWGATYFALIAIELLLAGVLSADLVVTLAPLLSLAGTLGLIVFTRQRMRATRDRLELVEHLKWPL